MVVVNNPSFRKIAIAAQLKRNHLSPPLRGIIDNLPDEAPLYPPSTIDRQRVRRTSTSSENPLEKETPPLPSPNTEPQFSEKNNQNSPNLITGIDQIKAELIDDKRFSLLESAFLRLSNG